MKYLIAYKQSENTYAFVKNISENIETTIFYGNALNFITESNAKNIAYFLNEYDKNHNYIVVEYEYYLREV